MNLDVCFIALRAGKFGSKFHFFLAQQKTKFEKLRPKFIIPSFSLYLAHSSISDDEFSKILFRLLILIPLSEPANF